MWNYRKILKIAKVRVKLQSLHGCSRIFIDFHGFYDKNEEFLHRKSKIENFYQTYVFFHFGDMRRVGRRGQRVEKTFCSTLRLYILHIFSHMFMVFAHFQSLF